MFWNPQALFMAEQATTVFLWHSFFEKAQFCLPKPSLWPRWPQALRAVIARTISTVLSKTTTGPA